MLEFKHLTWEQFDAAVAGMSRWIERLPEPPSGLYGMPRGGLPLAVALSHSTGLPMLAAWAPGCVVVDDIIDSGLILRPFFNRFCHVCVWVDLSTFELPDNVYVDFPSGHPDLDDVGWIVFPWERPEHATVDRLTYLAGRPKLQATAS
jgi:hypoxanthine phosphoribosyltransferase